MYAFCLIGHDGRVWLVRDPFGIKPLYYRQTEGMVQFASEPRALLGEIKELFLAGGLSADSRSKTEQYRQRAMAEQLKISRHICASRVGHSARVLVENATSAPDSKEAAAVSSWEHGLIRSADRSQKVAKNAPGQLWTARGEADAPDIDGRVYLRGAAAPGEFCQVKIIGHTDYDLVAEPV